MKRYNKKITDNSLLQKNWWWQTYSSDAISLHLNLRQKMKMNFCQFPSNLKLTRNNLGLVRLGWVK